MPVYSSGSRRPGRPCRAFLVVIYITVAATTEHYASGHVLAYAEAERKRGNAPVDRRARLVNGQYLKKAHKSDMKYNLTRTVNGTGHTSPSEFCAGKDS